MQIDPTKRPSRSLPDLHSDSKTVRYELENLIGIATEFSPDWADKNLIRNNAYIEAFAIHCRALILFIYGHLDGIAANGKTSRFPGIRDNDVVAYDFYRSWDSECPAPTELMVSSKFQADKHVAHITTERREVNQSGSAKESVWNIGNAASEISTIMAHFLAKAPAGNFDPAELRRMNASLAAVRTPAVSNRVYSVAPPMRPNSSLQAKTDARTLSPGGGFTIHGKTG
jgi:hypothetical protein